MSHITLAQQGLAAADARQWDEAITKLSKALQSSPNPAWLIARSKALIGVKRFREALDDANLAWHKAYERSRRPLLIDAHYRRAVAYYRLGELANADCCCVYAMRLVKGEPAVEKRDPKEKWTDANGFWTATLKDAQREAQEDPINQRQEGGGMDVALGSGAPASAKEWRTASTLRSQILFAMEKLPADDEKRKVTTSLKPEVKKLSDVTANVTTNKPEEGKETKTDAVPEAKTAPATSKPQVPSDTPLRIQDFQTNTAMTVSIFTKGVNKDKLQVSFEPLKARLIPIVYPNGEEKGVQFDLWAEIDPAASKYTVTPNKVELTLVKKAPGKWKQPFSDTQKFEADADAEATEAVNALKEARKKAQAAAEAPGETTSSATNTATKDTKAPAVTAGPAYPTSSVSGPKNWDSIADDDSDDESKQGVNQFFKNLYKGATPEQQRAMMKSFTESNGTSLSTDWDDVKGRTVETVPPEGVEAKKWD